MNNLLSRCRLVAGKTSSSDTDLPVIQLIHVTDLKTQESRLHGGHPSLLVTLWSGLFLLHFWWQRICVPYGCGDSSIDSQDLGLLESYFVHSYESTGK